MTPSWKLLVRGMLCCGALSVACSASAPPDDSTTSGGPADSPAKTPLSPDAGPSLDLPNDEVCGNATDDDGDGLVDEDCDCEPTGYSGGEFPSAGPCKPVADASTGCTPTAATEVSCDDGSDDDCDGATDCDDADCHTAGQCGCMPSEAQCSDGLDDDCDGVVDCDDDDCPKCVPGSTRYCDEPVYCAWGQQVCGPDGRWGKCIEVPPPSGCEGFFGFDTFFDLDCCLAKGLCCQAYPADHSVGNCGGIAVCP